jgi:hypothetical protein
MSKQKFYIILITVAVMLFLAWFLILRKRNRILRNASRFIGLQEIPQNKGFYNSDFEQKMISAGFKTGYEWCMLFVKMVLRETLTGDQLTELNKLFTPSTQQTFENIESGNSKYFKIVDNPRPGDIVIWQSKAVPYKGHAAIYKKMIDSKGNFETIEGNANNEVSELKRGLNGTSVMKIRGFIRVK